MQTQNSLPNFNIGDSVEAPHPTDSRKINRFYPATVLSVPINRNNNLMLLEYQTLFSYDSSSSSAPNELLRHYVHMGSLRPKLPHEQLSSSLKVGDSVDAYRRRAWCSGVVAEILERSKYAVLFNEGGKSKRVVVKQRKLRLHREWVDGKWAPPIVDDQKLQEPPETAKKNRNIKIKITYSGKTTPEPKFNTGVVVEVCTSEEDYKGGWFIATIVDLIGTDRYLVEYRDLLADDKPQHLKEQVHERCIRPCPPQVTPGDFKQFQEVDALHKGGWWEGVVLDIVNSNECYVSLINGDLLKVENFKLRPHQNWSEDKWIISSKDPNALEEKFGDIISRAKNLNENSSTSKHPKSRVFANEPRDNVNVAPQVKSRRIESVSRFRKGAKVEVRSDEVGFEGAWYDAVVIDHLQTGKYLVEYLTLKTDNYEEQLRDQADVSDIRPCPPDFDRSHRFANGELVDAWYNEGWWEGQIFGVLSNSNYMVHFWPTGENLEFKHCHLRPRQEWVGGKWVQSHQ